MSFTDNFLKELEKKKKKLDNTEVESPYSGGNKTSQQTNTTLSGGDDFTTSFLKELDKATKREEKRRQRLSSSNAAPVTSTTKKEEDDVAPTRPLKRDKSGELKEHSDLFTPEETTLLGRYKIAKEKEEQEQKRALEARKKELKEYISILESDLGYDDSLWEQAISFNWAQDVIDLVPSGTLSERGATKKKLREAKEELAALEGKTKKSSYFQSGSLEDGFQFEDLIVAPTATVTDSLSQAVGGVLGVVEGVTDLILHGGGYVADALGADGTADWLHNEANLNSSEEVVDFITPDATKDDSFLGDKSRGIFQAAGNMAAMVGLAYAGGAAGLSKAGTTALTTGVTFSSAAGHGITEAQNYEKHNTEAIKKVIEQLDAMYQDGEITQEQYDKEKSKYTTMMESFKVSDGEEIAYGIMAGASEAVTELFFGGLGKGINAVGFSQGLGSADDALAKAVSSKFKSQITKNLAEYGIKAGAEGFEEVLAGIGQVAAKKATYMSEEDWGKLFADENLLDQFIAGVVVSGMAQSGYIPGTYDGSLRDANKSGKDFITGLTANEQSVVNKEVENLITEAEKDGKELTNKEKNKIYDQVLKDLDKGYISTDTIEEVLGGDSYKSYQDTVKSEDALQKEFDELEALKESEITVKQRKRLNELEAQIEELKTTSERDFLQRKYKNEAFEIARGSRLEESYRERSRRGQAYTADLSKYNEKQRAVVQKAIDSGILNNTNRTHEFVDMVAKISADKGVLFDFTNNAKLKESGFAIGGKTVNGYVTNDGITINIQSNKSLNSVVGHEITHVLEGTELYTELQNAVVEYAKTKGDYQGRYDALAKLYETVEGADINAELTADLVGDYLFTDADFINNLSTKHRNVFQKIYDEIKYLYKTATAGTKEARELEKVKRAFEKAYQAQGKAQGDTKYSITESFTDANGNSYDNAVLLDTDFFDGISPRNWGVKLKEEVNRRANEDPFILPIVDENGNTTILQFAGSNERAAKDDGADHKVLNELTTTSDNISKLAVIHIDEIVSVSEENVPYFTDENSHGWMDKNGWLHRNANVINKKNGNIYNLTVDIAKTEDGRTILYATNGKIKKVGNVKVDSLKIKGPRQNSNSGDIVPQKEKVVNRKNSLSTDSEGNQLSEKQAEYFKDSKMRDDNGNLKVMYHGTQKGGFYEFDPNYSDDDISLFFVDRNDVAMSYSGTSETYAPKAFKTPDEINNFFAEIGKSEYEVAEKDGKYTLYDDGDEVATSDNLSEIFEEFKDWEGVGYGDVNYKAYLNLVNPLVVEANGKEWHNLTGWSKSAYLTAEDTTVKQVGDDFRLYKNGQEIESASIAVNTYTQKLGADDLKHIMIDKANNILSINTETLTTTRDVAKWAKQNGYDGVIFNNIRDNGGYSNGSEGASTVAIAFDSNQVKSVANDAPTSDPDIRYSLSEYTAEEKKAHNKAVLDHFGKTYNWNETGYLLLDGTRLDLSDKHDGAPGGYRTVDHRDITEALGYDYGGGDYSGSLVQFMSEGNIRIIPECNGINLSVKPTEAQEQALSSYISRHRGEVLLDIDDLNGNTVVSVEYPYGTYYTKVLNDIHEWFDNGKKPENASSYSLTKNGDTPKRYGSYNVYGKDVALEGALAEDVAPVQEEVAPIEAAEGPMTERAEVLPDDYAPMSEDEAAKIENEALDSITDEDAPPEVEMPYYEQRDTGTIDNKSLKGISERASEYLGLNRTERATLEGIIQNYSQNENLTREDLYSEMKDKFSVIEEMMPNEDVIQIKKDLRAMKLYVSDEVKADFGKGAEDGYTKFLRSNFGRLKIVKDISSGVPVDSAYEELSSLYPSYFPDDIINPADQLRRIADMAAMPSEDSFAMELSDAEIESVADMVYTDISDYMNEMRLNSATEASYVPLSDADAPVEPEVETENKVLSVREMYEQKKNNYKETLAAYEAGKEKSLANFQEAIGNKLNEYNALKNKNTQRANNLLQQIERLRLRRDNVQADYTNRIAKQQARVEAFENKSFEEFEQKELAVRRKDYHKQIVDNVKAQFEAQGYDLDEVLKHAKDLSTFATVDNTPQRVMEKALGWKEGHILSDITVNKVAQNETEGIKWLNTITDKKNGLLANLVKEYGIKPGSKESAAAQMYAEGFYVAENNDIIKYGDAELAKDFPDSKVRENIKALSKDQRVRQFYDETLKAINESRARNAYPEIPKLDNYFLHFRAMEDTFSRLGLPFNPNDIRAKDLPTDLNGVTADLKPGQPYFASAKHRMGQRTSFDLLGGLEKYAMSAKNQIYHIDDIQTLRAIRNYVADTYGQAKGLENLDSLTEEEVQERIKDVYGSHLSTFAKFLNEEANVLAGKTALIDRGLEGIIGRRAMTFMDTVNRQVGSNMVGYNVSSALTNLIAPVQAFAKTNKGDFIKGFAQTVADKVKSIHGKSDGFSEASPVVIRRKGSDRFHRTAWQKLSDPGYALMGAVDNFSTEIIARAKYNELTRKGMDSETAHIETDKWVSRLMGDRSLGQMPQLYNSKMLGLVTKFQLEVRNQLDSQFYDTIKEANASTKDIQNGLHRNAKKAAKITSTFFTLAVGQHLFGKAFEAVAGYNPAFDIISVLIKALGFDDDEDSEDTVLDNIEQGFFELMGDMPYTSILEGGRIPISSALPIEELYKGEDQYGNEKSRWKTILEALPYYTMPGGYGQFKKTTQGLGMFDDDLPISGSYTDSGKLRFPVEDTPWNRVQAGLFGQYASENGRDYFDNERKALDEKQIQEFIDSGISIQDYWEYREGLSGLKTLEEKAEYIYGLDIPTETKNLFINNLSGRKEDIDLSGMGEYDNFKEYDFATKNPEKYAFLKEHNISVSDYENFDDDTKEAYTWAFNNPEKYTVSKAIASDLMTYRGYTKELYDIKADKDSDGKSISGSRKEKVIDYINNMDADYGQKIILFKTEYPADDTYNNDIIEYLNDREDISYEEMVTILKELGFTVKGNNVYWD